MTDTEGICLDTDRETRPTDGTRDLVIGLENYSFTVGLFLFRIGSDRVREIRIDLTCSKYERGIRGFVGSVK